MRDGKMDLQKMIGCITTHRPDLMNKWIEVCVEGHKQKEGWIAALRERNVKAAHPNDGWVNREEQYIDFTYPQFFDDVTIGDLVAIGDPDEYRIVRITHITGNFIKKYHYKDTPED